MIYKNNTHITGVYLNGRQIANGYKGEIQFFGEGGSQQPRNYLCFTSLEDGNEISFTVGSTNTTPIVSAFDVSYDDGESWESWEYQINPIILNQNDKVYIAGYNPAGLSSGTSVNQSSSFSFTKLTEASGNIMSLIFAHDFEGETNLSGIQYCFNRLFYGCRSLTTAPELPATILADYCYTNMFRGCTSLTTAPELPATTLATSCYASMFNTCTSLTTAPELPATTLVDSCYNYMFYGCANLNYIKAMFTTTPSTSYTNSWVNGVSATGTFVKNSTATWNVTGNNGIPTGWTVQIAGSEKPLFTQTYTSTTCTIDFYTESGLGTITIKVNGVSQNIPYTINRPLYDTYYEVEATNTDPGNPPTTVNYSIPVMGTKTEDPVIEYSNNTVTATGYGTVLLYKDGVQVSNPYNVVSADVGQTFTFTATAQEQDRTISNTVSETITIEELVSQTVQITIAEMVSEFGWTNSTDNVKDTDWTIKGITFRFEKGAGSTTPKYYSAGSGAIRFYAKNIMTITAGSSTIKQVKITSGGTYAFIESDCQEASSYTLNEDVAIFDFNPSITHVVITNSTTSQRRPNYFEITLG